VGSGEVGREQADPPSPGWRFALAGVAVAAGALVAELAKDIAASTVTGVGAGSLLTVFAVLALSRPKTSG
jgi:hypothetical protein